MLSTIQAMWLMAWRLTQLCEAGTMTHEQASLVKAWTTLRGREVGGRGGGWVGGWAAGGGPGRRAWASGQAAQQGGRPAAWKQRGAFEAAGRRQICAALLGVHRPPLAEAPPLRLVTPNQAPLAATCRSPLGRGCAALRPPHCGLPSAPVTQVVSLGRELLGGNGILSEFLVAKAFCDAEAYYRWEWGCRARGVGPARGSGGAATWQLSRSWTLACSCGGVSSGVLDPCVYAPVQRMLLPFFPACVLQL